jgi:hypothetical protein
MLKSEHAKPTACRVRKRYLRFREGSRGGGVRNRKRGEAAEERESARTAARARERERARERWGGGEGGKKRKGQQAFRESKRLAPRPVPSCHSRTDCGCPV